MDLEVNNIYIFCSNTIIIWIIFYIKKDINEFFTSEYYRKWKNIQIVAKYSFFNLSYDYIYMIFLDSIRLLFIKN